MKGNIWIEIMAHCTYFNRLTQWWTHAGTSIQAVVCAVVHLAALPRKVGPAVAPPVSFLIGQATTSIFTRGAAEFTCTTAELPLLRVQGCAAVTSHQPEGCAGKVWKSTFTEVWSRSRIPAGGRFNQPKCSQCLIQRWYYCHKTAAKI